MFRFRFLFPSALVVGALFAFGCASNPEYGIKPDPALKAAEGKEDGAQLRDQIRKENLRAIEEGDEPIFQTDDRY